MARRKNDQEQAAPAEIKCENCHNFTGYAHRFECAKAHTQENFIFFVRSSCEDFSLMSREELIFKRFKNSSWRYGSELVKNKKSVVRRTATSLRSAMSEFEKFLTLEQCTAISNAAAVFDQIGNELAVVAGMAAKYKAEKDAEYERERLAELDKVSDGFFGIAGPAKIVELSNALDSFYAEEGKKWYQDILGHKDGYYYSNDRLGDRLANWRADPTNKNLLSLKREAAKYVTKLTDGFNRLSSEPTLNHFYEFMAWKTRQMEIDKVIEADPNIVKLHPIKRR